MSKDGLIEETIFEFLAGHLPMSELESWVYSESALQPYFGEDDYLELISLDFRGAEGRYRVEKLFKSHVTGAAFITWYISRLARRIIARTENVQEDIYTLYELYCRGYDFLRTLGMSYGLRIGVPPVTHYRGTWDDLSPAQKVDLIDSFYPQIAEEARLLLSVLEDGRIVITNASIDSIHPGRPHLPIYDDHRTTDEKLQMEPPVLIID